MTTTESSTFSIYTNLLVEIQYKIHNTLSIYYMIEGATSYNVYVCMLNFIKVIVVYAQTVV